MKKTKKIQRMTSTVKIRKKNVKERKRQSLNPLMPRLPELSIQETSSFSHVLAEDDIFIVPFTDIENIEKTLKSHKLCIDLNKPTFEEDSWGDMVEAGEIYKEHKYENSRKIIKHIKENNIKLKFKNSKLQQKVQRLEENHHKLSKFSRKLRKKNIKLY
jgi:hypothetical protein